MAQPSVRNSLTRTSLLMAFFVTLGFVVPATSAAAPGSQGGKTTGTYENPLQPVIPGDGVVESCADPTVTAGTGAGRHHLVHVLHDRPAERRGRRRERGPDLPQDPDDDLGGPGQLDLRRRRVPAGPAGLPGWAEHDAALWAPEVVYSTTFDQYYMFFVVTDTTAAVSGERELRQRQRDRRGRRATARPARGPSPTSRSSAPRQRRRRLQLPLDVRPRRARRLHRATREHPLLRQLLRRRLRHRRSR